MFSALSGGQDAVELMLSPSFGNLEAMKSLFLAKFGSLAAAWRSALDTLLFRKHDFSKKRAPPGREHDFGDRSGPRSAQDKVALRSLQDGLRERLLFVFVFIFDFDSFWVPFWSYFGVQKSA